MDELATGEPRWKLVFDQEGQPKGLDRGRFFTELRDSGVEDLFVFSHGWNSDESAARGPVRRHVPRIRDACAEVHSLGSIGFAGVLWPSMWFPETSAVLHGPGGSEQAEGSVHADDTSGSNALTGTEIVESLLPSFADECDREAILAIGRADRQGRHGPGVWRAIGNRAGAADPRHPRPRQVTCAGDLRHVDRGQWGDCVALDRFADSGLPRGGIDLRDNTIRGRYGGRRRLVP